jgi:magnesium chelatase accessory protein
MNVAPDWDTDGRDWPHREASRFVVAGRLRWHVQQMGAGPVALLIHGTGASTHSWRGLAPLLARDFTVVAPDLPGHGYTECPPAQRLSLPGMAESVAALVRELGLAPRVVVGHSAGAAILARLCIDGGLTPAGFVSLNGALLPLGGARHPTVAGLARFLTTGSFLPRLFAWRAADRAVVERLLAGTGSTLDAPGTEFYARLARKPGHVAGALGMMAMWDPRPLARDLPRLRVPLVLVAADRDKMIVPATADRVKALVPGARIEHLPGLGHLAHEERPDLMVPIIRAAAGLARDRDAVA